MSDEGVEPHCMHFTHTTERELYLRAPLSVQAFSPSAPPDLLFTHVGHKLDFFFFFLVLELDGWGYDLLEGVLRM